MSNTDEIINSPAGENMEGYTASWIFSIGREDKIIGQVTDEEAREARNDINSDKLQKGVVIKAEENIIPKSTESKSDDTVEKEGRD